MVSQSSFEYVALRYAPYIKELQDFFSIRTMDFGTPADMFQLAELLRKPGFFREEMSSLVRAIVYRECEGITRAELLELIALAAGGPGIENASQDLHQPIDQIMDFLGQVLQSLWRSFPDEISPEESAAKSESVEEEASDPTPIEVAPPPVIATQTLEAGSARPVEPSPALPVAASMRTPAPPRNEMLFRALAISSAEKEAPAPTPGIWRRWLWLTATAVVLAVALAILLAGPGRRQAASSDAAALQASAQAAADADAASQPSADGSPLSTSETADGSASSGKSVRAASEGTDPDPLVPSPAQILASPRALAPNTGEVSPRAKHSSGTGNIGASSLYSGNTSSTERPVRAPRSKAGGVFFVSSGLMTDNLISAPAPEYPKLAKLARIEGSVILQAVVSPSGTVSATRVLSGHLLLRGAAERAVRHWTYRPYIMRGRATDIATIITIDFRLRH